MNGLCSTNKVSLETVQAVPCPEGTKSWRPISHFDLIQEAKQAAKNTGLVIGNEQYGLHKDNNQMFGVIEVLNHDHFDNEVRLMMGIRNSIDKSLSAGVCFGSKVFVCDNLCFSAYDTELGESFLTTRKHTTFIEEDLPIRLAHGMSRFAYAKRYQEKLYGGLKQSALSLMHVHDILVKASLEGAIPNKDIPKVREEYLFHLHTPETEEQANRWQESFSKPTAWSLFNAFTQAAKSYQAKNGLVSSDRMIKLTKLFQKEFIN